MKVKVTLTISLGILLLYSCAIHIVNGTEYDLLKPENQARIKELKSFETLHRDSIYELTATQLKADLRKQPKSIIYIFKSSCQSNYCVPLRYITEYAQKQGMKPYLILVNYYQLERSLDQNPTVPLFAINAAHYQESKSRKYLKRFEHEIGYTAFCEKHQAEGNLLFFEGDSLVEVRHGLNEAK
ncbi:MAG: hypothetical protein ACKOWO_05480 [Sediminibacterium sp.]